jgi:predicted transcriptional regulator
MLLHPALQAVVALTRDRWWQLPHSIGARQRQHRNAYMRAYMRAYRQSAHAVSASLTDEERRRLAQEAEALGRKPTVCFREAAFAYFDRRTLLPKAYEEQLAAAIGEIRRVGNNLNQLAHHANARRRATHREVQEARRLLADLEAAVTRRLLPWPLPAAAAPDGGEPSA